MSIWLQIAALLLWIPVIGVIHEMGHAVLARPAGFRLTSFMVGSGKPLVRHRGNGGVIYSLGRWFFTGGSCVAIPIGLGRGPKAALYHAGGVLFQGVLAVLLVLLPEAWWTGPVAQFNALVILWNLVPWRVGGHASDGWWLMTCFTTPNAATGQLYGRRPLLERMLHFQEQVGSPLGKWHVQMMLAWSNLLVGATDDRFFEEDAPEAALDPTLDVLHATIQSEWHRLRGRPLASLQLLKKTRDAYGVSLSDEAADLLAIAFAKAWLAVEEPRGAREALGRVAGVGGIVGQEAAALLVKADVLEGKIDAAEASARRLMARMSGPFLDGPEAVKTLWSAGQLMQEDGRIAASDQVCRAAQRAAGRMIAAAIPEDRGPLVRRIGEPAGLRRTQGAVL